MTNLRESVDPIWARPVFMRIDRCQFDLVSQSPSVWRCAVCDFEWRAKHNTECPPVRTCSLHRAFPTLTTQLTNYRDAIKRYWKAGRPKRTDAETHLRVLLCAGCRLNRDGRCTVCGCPVNEKKLAIRNKARMATEVCPICRWENFPGSLFERVYCVNLDRREDRWERFTAGVPAEWPWPTPERFPAVDGQRCPPPPWWTQGPGAWGCYRSHLAIMERCLNEGVGSVLILEDDAAFIDDFTAKATLALAEVPDDWGMLYLGGQHFKTTPPTPISEYILKPANVQRTHAYALRGQTLRDVYQFLSDTQSETWKPRHHVDHRLGVFLETHDAPAYAVAHWLVGQGAGRSDVGAGSTSARWWRNSATTGKRAIPQAIKPVVAVVGPFRSGTSCVAGVLHTLGVSMGERFRRPMKGNPKGTFEAVALGELCRSFFTEPGCLERQPHEKRVAGLRRWAASRSAGNSPTIGAKHPLLCLMMTEMCEAWPGVRFVFCDRPPSESNASMAKWGGKWKAAKRTAETMIEARDDNAADITNPILRVDYHALLADPAGTVERLIAFLGLDVPAETRQAAIDFIDPQLCHHDHHA